MHGDESWPNEPKPGESYAKPKNDATAVVRIRQVDRLAHWGGRQAWFIAGLQSRQHGMFVHKVLPASPRGLPGPTKDLRDHVHPHCGVCVGLGQTIGRSVMAVISGLCVTTRESS